MLGHAHDAVAGDLEREQRRGGVADADDAQLVERHRLGTGLAEQLEEAVGVGGRSQGSHAALFDAPRPGPCRYGCAPMDVPDGFVPWPDQGPYLEHIGPVHVRDGGDDDLVLGLRAEDRHTNHRGTVQGGLLSTFADFALGRAIEADADDGKDRATVSLTVDYLKPAKPGDWIESRTRVERVGGTLAFADCSLTVDGREIVRARSVWVVAG
jgi:uncharacterized protein (TIGR00369 family)